MVITQEISEQGATATEVTANLEPNEATPYRGCIDGFDAELGISGWALKLAATDIAVTVEFVVDGLVVYECRVSRIRSDLSALLSQRGVTPGFLIPAATLKTLGNLISLRPRSDFSIRIANTSFALPRVDGLPDLGAMVNSCIEATDPRGHRFNLHGHLTQVRAMCDLMHLPLRPQDDQLKGFIEGLCVEDQGSGLLWFVGWTSDPASTDEPAVIADRRKFSAAFSIITFPRDDLQPEARGLIGVILSDWRPVRDSNPIVYFGSKGRSQFLSVPDLPRITKTTFLDQLNWARKRQPIGRWLDMLALAQGLSNLPSQGNPDDVRAALDRLLVLPGVGCFATGWVLSYTSQVRGFGLSVGDTILPMDASSLRFTARTDLGVAFPDAVPLQARAGFCCFFPGQPDMRILEQPLLRVILDDGRAAAFGVEIARIRQLGYSEPFDSLLTLYPFVDRERFFPQLKQSIRSAYRAVVSKVTPYRARAAVKTLVIALSADRCDARLALEEVRHNAPLLLARDCGIVIIANTSQQHGEVVELFEFLDRSLDQQCSLFFCEDTTCSAYVLGELLLLTKSERFVLIGANHFLTERGWNAVSEVLESKQNDLLVFFTAADPVSLQEIPRDGSCLSWTRRAFFTWAEHMPPLVEEQFDRNDFPASPVKTINDGAYISRSAQASRMASLVNKSAREDANTEPVDD